MKKKIIISHLKDIIFDFLDEKIKLIDDEIDREKSEFTMIYKYVSHSDLLNCGKRNGKNQGLDKNFLYYLTTEEMKEIEKKSFRKEFESAKQSNIYMPDIFYNILCVKKLERRKGTQKKQHPHVKINDYADVFVVNKTLEYFSFEYTKEIFEKLEKDPKWLEDDCKYKLSEGNLTKIQLTYAIHGIGTSDDNVFKSIRRSIFKNDIIITLIENKKDGSKKVYLFFEKNPKFLSILNATNEKWEKYLNQTNRIGESLLSREEILLDRKTRVKQSRWRKMLADEIMNFTTEDGEVFCPITFVNADFDNLGALFRASHIKAFSDCDKNEAYDINNGLLLSANADALFDKHLITISEDKKMIYSFLIEGNHILLSNLKLNENIFGMILNDKRMDYLKTHRDEFYRKEVLRKMTNR